jgi:hypothetical protein
MPMELVATYETLALLRTAVPIDGQRYTILQSVPIVLMKGQVLDVLSEVQATNNTDQWAMWGAYVIASTDHAATTGEQISGRGVMNFNPAGTWVGRSDVHHLVHVKNGIWVCNQAGTYYVSLVSWATTDPPQPTWALDVDQNIGSRLSVKVFG